MNTMIYNQLRTDIQEYMMAQYKLLQAKGIEHTSQLIGLIISIVMMAAIVVIGLLFLAIALAAWIEHWLPMWASYLVIAGAMLLIALLVYWGRRWWFVRPIEKHLGMLMMDDARPMEQQKQSLEGQVATQRELLQRDVAAVRQEWSWVEWLLRMFDRTKK